jgi:hypothetical protein
VRPPEDEARAALGQAAVDLVVAIERYRKVKPKGAWTDENGVARDLGEPNGPSNPYRDMRLARAFLVQLATPRYWQGDARQLGALAQPPPDQDQIPQGFWPIWGGEAAVQILALDRDRLGAPVEPMDLAALLVHPGPGPAPGWRTGP